MSLVEEIRQQPAVIQDALSANAAHIDRVADDLDADGFDYVMIAARGTSDMLPATPNTSSVFAIGSR